jgi:hypothetical protein
MSDPVGPENPVGDIDIEAAEARLSRRRTAMILTAVACVAAAGLAVGLVSTIEPEPADPSADITDSVADPALALPTGCDLLTPFQLSEVVPINDPSKLTRIGRGPEPVLDYTESACHWINEKTDPTDPRVQPAAIEVTVTANSDEKAARETLQISLPCQGPDSRKTTVPGAEEACLSHKKPDRKISDDDAATVSARYKTLVVEVSYQRRNWPQWRVEDQSEVTASALIGRIVQSH